VPPSRGGNTNHQTKQPCDQQTPIETNNNTTTTINDGTNEVNTHTYINAQISTHNNNNNNSDDMAEETQPIYSPPPVAAPINTINTTVTDVKDKVVVCGCGNCNELNSTNNNNTPRPHHVHQLTYVPRHLIHKQQQQQLRRHRILIQIFLQTMIHYILRHIQLRLTN